MGIACVIGAGCAGDGSLLPLNPLGDTGQGDLLVRRVRLRLSLMKPGMTEAQVDWVLWGLPLGDGTVAAVTSCGGKTVCYQLDEHHRLDLEILPKAFGDPCTLVSATVTETGS
jgi:hypothetical protein